MAVTNSPINPSELLFCAEWLDDLERTRIAAENRLRSLGAEGMDVSRYAPQVEAFKQMEHQATLELQAAMRRHPQGPFVSDVPGLGLKQTARLVASIGDLAYNHADDRPRRGPAELWAYCGYVPGQRRKRGEKANWNATAKMRAYLCAESCIKQKHSPYREIYEQARAKYKDAVHPEPCVRCGPKGKPAPAGSPLSKGHQHAAALRIVAKAILKDLYLDARRTSGLGTGTL